MKNQQRLLKYLIVLSILTPLFLACSENEISPTALLQKNVSNSDKEVYSVEGILAFKSLAKVNEYSNLQLNINSEQRRKFEEKYKFTSLITEVENDYKLNEKQIGLLLNNNKLINFKNGRLNHNLFSDALASLVNKDGLMIIGASLFKITKNKILNISLIKVPKLQDAIGALNGNSTFSKLVRTSTVAFSEMNVGNKNARIDLAPNQQTYSQSSFANYITKDCQLCSVYAIIMESKVTVASFYFSYESCTTFEYDPNCGCNYCSSSVINSGYSAYVNSSIETYKQYQNGNRDYTISPSNYLRMKSTNANVYANGVQIPVRYDLRQTNSTSMIRDVWSRWQDANGSYTVMGAEGNFDFELQHPRTVTMSSTINI